MKFWECDYCGNHSTSEPNIILKGITGTSGGILLPEQCHERTFCSSECFWKWIEKYIPDEQHQVEEKGRIYGWRKVIFDPVNYGIISSE